MKDYYKQLNEYEIHEYRKIAFLYYKKNLSQSEVAKRLNTSRQRINRILQRCQELGIVKIEVSDPNSNILIESMLEEKFNLKHVEIINNNNSLNLYKEIGASGARYLERILKDGDIIGFSRGKTVQSIVNEMQLMDLPNLIVTELFGNKAICMPDHEGQSEADTIVRNFANKTNSKINMIYAPVISLSSEYAKIIKTEPVFRESYNVVKKCNIAVLGIGNVKRRIGCKDSFYNICSEEDKEKIKNNIEGEVCTQFFDENGQEIKLEISDRIIGIEKEDFFDIPIRLGIAVGQEKLEAIKGALKGGYVNVLISDQSTANLLLKE